MSKKQIFISYAKEDIAIAKRIYEDINKYEKYGIVSWIDKENLTPGLNYKIEISKAIKKK